MKTTLSFFTFCLFIVGIVKADVARPGSNNVSKCCIINFREVTATDTVPPSEVMDIIATVIYSTDKFDIEAVANLYTPNAVIADDEPPYSWNGPTAGVQWVNAVEKACKDNRLTKFKAKMEPVNVYQQNADNIYMIVPVTYTALLPGKARFISEGAFTFVLRLVNGKWMIKSQAWVQKKGM